MARLARTGDRLAEVRCSRTSCGGCPVYVQESAVPDWRCQMSRPPGTVTARTVLWPQITPPAAAP